MFEDIKAKSLNRIREGLSAIQNMPPNVVPTDLPVGTSSLPLQLNHY